MREGVKWEYIHEKCLIIRLGTDTQPPPPHPKKKKDEIIHSRTATGRYSSPGLADPKLSRILPFRPCPIFEFVFFFWAMARLGIIHNVIPILPLAPLLPARPKSARRYLRLTLFFYLIRKSQGARKMRGGGRSKTRTFGLFPLSPPPPPCSRCLHRVLSRRSENASRGTNTWAKISSPTL